MRLRHLLTHSLARQREYNPRAFLNWSTLAHFRGRAHGSSVPGGHEVRGLLETLARECCGSVNLRFLRVNRNR
jgi:hypothetical protein